MVDINDGEVKVITVSCALDEAGLVWYPEIGDEVTQRSDLGRVAIFVDPQGLTLNELRESFLWLPTVEQLVQQFEARQALIYHAGITEKLTYKTVIRVPQGVIETTAPTLRVAFGQALRQLLRNSPTGCIH